MYRFSITVLLIPLCALSFQANAHRSGCHRWHSCPSDSGSYVCGDTGYCNYCPDNQYCKNGQSIPVSRRSLEPDVGESERGKPIGTVIWAEGIVISKHSKPEDQTNYLHTLEGKVVGITDGDTLKLLVDNRQIKIRLAQIDTPERNQPYGSRAKQALSDLTFGKEVMAKVETIDRYGRSVARIYVDGVDVSAEMVRQGAAWVYRKYATDESLYEIEKEAQEAGRGLWALPEAQRVPPWEWRRR